LFENEGLRVSVEVVVVRSEVVVELAVNVVVEVEVFFLRGMGTGFPSESIVASWYRCLSDSCTRRWRVSNVRFSRWNFGKSSYLKLAIMLQADVQHTEGDLRDL